MREITNYQASNLRALLEAQGTKFRWLADRVGISESHLSRIINGERLVSESLGRRISEAARVDFFVAFKLTDRSITFSVREQVPA
jgi:transcriptional regulator with XRE-family HTH domain